MEFTVLGFSLSNNVWGCLGFDRTLCISPLERMDNVQSHLSSAPVMRSNTFRRFYTHDVVSSVRWRTADPNGCSWTGDGGLYQLIDCRAGSLAMKFNVSQHINFSITGGTFSHEYLTPDEFGVSFGFEHGQMAIFDIRKFKNPWYVVLTSFNRVGWKWTGTDSNVLALYLRLVHP